MINYNTLTFQNLHDPQRYELQIDKIFNRVKDRKGLGALFETEYEGVPLFSFGYDRREIARYLAISVRNESYRFTPPVQKLVKTKNKNKKRLLYHINVLDKIVICVLANLLTELLLPFLNPCVFSYRKGVSAKDEVVSLARYIQAQQAPTSRKGVYLLQTDIASYSDEINVQDTSGFWSRLAEYFDKLGLQPTDYHWYLIKQAVRPDHYNLDGALVTNLKGAPTGSPITTVLYNYYVACVDFYLTCEPDLFYARYSDDIVICHADRSVVESAEDYLHIYLKAISLGLSEKKTNRLYFTSSGHADSSSGWKGTNRINLLGYSLNGSGHYCISTTRQHKFLTKIRYRVKNSLNILKDFSLGDQGRYICQVANSLLTDDTTGSHLLTALQQSNDPVQLKHLDYQIALIIAEALTGINGPKAFRTVSYRKLRQEWGLQSLLMLRHSKRHQALHLV